MIRQFTQIYQEIRTEKEERRRREIEEKKPGRKGRKEGDVRKKKRNQDGKG